MQDKSFTGAETRNPVAVSPVPMQAANSQANRYAIDSVISRFTVRAFASGLLSALGHSPTIAIHQFGGEVRLGAESLTGAGVCMTIQADSLAVQDQISDKDRSEMERHMRETVLEIERFPEIRYECSSVDGVYDHAGQSSIVLQGSLTLCGRTRTVPVNARFGILGNVLRASGEFVVRQSDFDIRQVSAIGGTVRVKDELKFSFDIAARKQAEAR